jgi:chemotaxis protein MotB
MSRKLTCGLLVTLASLGGAGCVADSLVEEQEAEIRAARRGIDELEIRLGALRSETRRLERQAGPEATAKRRAELEEDLGRYGLRVTSRGPELVVTLASTVLFASGEVTVRNEAKAALTGLAEALNRRFPHRAVRVEGHTDSARPVRIAEKYPTNWELSAARALAVLNVLVEEGGVSRERAFAAAYGQYRPVSENSTREGREGNRRVDIVILPPVGFEKTTMVGLVQ